jgi:hypothetical protein
MDLADPPVYTAIGPFIAIERERERLGFSLSLTLSIAMVDHAVNLQDG